MAAKKNRHGWCDWREHLGTKTKIEFNTITGDLRKIIDKKTHLQIHAALDGKGIEETGWPLMRISSRELCPMHPLSHAVNDVLSCVFPDSINLR